VVVEVRVLGGELEELVVIEEGVAVAHSEDEVKVCFGMLAEDGVEHGAERGYACAGCYKYGVCDGASGDEGSVGAFEFDFIVGLEIEEPGGEAAFGDEVGAEGEDAGFGGWWRGYGIGSGNFVGGEGEELAGDEGCVPVEGFEVEVAGVVG
jgi:hypothetical protein